MLQALFYGLITFGLIFMMLMIFERWLHKVTKNRSKAYRYGVWTFAVLAGLYAFATALGR